MIKKIPCIVVSSKPLDKGSKAPRYFRTSNNSHSTIKRIAQYKYAGHPVTYTRLLEITSASIDGGQTARIFDCYV
jgi:hypothetical protein